MATKLPRLALSLPAPTITVIAKLARLQKRPRSAIAADLLVEMTPALARIANVLEVAIVQRANLPTDTAARLESLEELLGSVATASLDQLEATVQPPGSGSGRRRAPPGHAKARRKH